MRPRIIICEGPDNCGKSTLAKLIANRYAGNYWHMTSGPGLEEHAAMSLYQLDALKNAEFNLKNGRTTVFDRHWVSDQVYGSILRDRPSLPFESMLKRSKEHDVLFIFCERDNAVEEHEKDKDPDHPYDPIQYGLIMHGYEEIRHQIELSMPRNVIGYQLDHFINSPNMQDAFLTGLSKL